MANGFKRGGGRGGRDNEDASQIRGQISIKYIKIIE